MLPPLPMPTACFAALRFFLSAVPHLPFSLEVSAMTPRSSMIFCTPCECPTSAAGTGPFLYVATDTCMDATLTPDTTSSDGKRRV